MGQHETCNLGVAGWKGAKALGFPRIYSGAVMGVFVSICRVVTVLACVAAAFTLAEAMLGRGQSAIQQAAIAGMACGMVLIPFVFTRMFEGFYFQPEKESGEKPISDADITA